MGQVERVAKVVQKLITCSSSDAQVASQAICRDPETIALLAAACGASGYVVSNGARATVSLAAVQAWPAAAASAVATGAGALAAKRFCSAVVTQGFSAVSESQKSILRRAAQ